MNFQRKLELVLSLPVSILSTKQIIQTYTIFWVHEKVFFFRLIDASLANFNIDTIHFMLQKLFWKAWSVPTTLLHICSQVTMAFWIWLCEWIRSREPYPWWLHTPKNNVRIFVGHLQCYWSQAWNRSWQTQSIPLVKWLLLFFTS